MARPSVSLIHTGFLLVVVLLPDLLGAVPLEQNQQEEGAAVTDDVKADALANLKKLVRNRRNVPVLAVPQFKRVPDFWGWYKYFMDTHNQEGVEDLDRLYMAYLQNKHRSEEGPTFNHYLKHLSEIYKTCANSDDPECIAESTSKPKAAVVMPSSIRSGAIRMCNPYIDPYCLYPLTSKPAAPEPEMAPAKVPAPILTPVLPMPLKSPTGFYYYAPVLEPFLNTEQRSELLRICHPDDVECLQYHLRAAYGYRPAASYAPSYAALQCDPNDPYCHPPLVQKGPSGYYQLLYPSCDPAVDPLCVNTAAAPAPLAAGEAPREQHCNPLFDAGCNPLTATRLSGLTKPVLEYSPKDKPAPYAAAPPAAPLTCDPQYNPYCILAAAAALRKPAPQLPEHQVRYNLGVRGKTKEGYDCFVHYDKDCTPVHSGSEASDKPFCHPYDPKCSKFSRPSKPNKSSVILPDPDCDPEYDSNCRLQHAEPASSADEPLADEEKPADEPTKKVSVPRFEDFLRGVLSQHK
ncbi:actinodin2 [Nothobranchius furzeri]|uniref:Actinodin2 n=4 Tax=Nothobranchius TaxID=28779 RepID=A0A8C6NPN1_NOTFU|nr:actinodin2 [Nothobranchius furzeri]KAF7222214.1 putative LOC107383616-like protein [Nothobranchius furzeri]